MSEKLTPKQEARKALTDLMKIDRENVRHTVTPHSKVVIGKNGIGIMRSPKPRSRHKGGSRSKAKRRP